MGFIMLDLRTIDTEALTKEDATRKTRDFAEAYIKTSFSKYFCFGYLDEDKIKVDLIAENDVKLIDCLNFLDCESSKKAKRWKLRGCYKRHLKNAPCNKNKTEEEIRKIYPEIVATATIGTIEELEKYRQNSVNFGVAFEKLMQEKMNCRPTDGKSNTSYSENDDLPFVIINGVKYEHIQLKYTGSNGRFPVTTFLNIQRALVKAA